MKNLPPLARVYVIAMISAGAGVFAAYLPLARFDRPTLFVVLLALSSLTAALKVNLLFGRSNMSVSYVVDIAALLLIGPHETMVIAAISGWTQSIFNVSQRNPPHRTLFNMACLVVTVQAAGQVFEALGGGGGGWLQLSLGVGAMAATYFFVNTVPIAMAIALSSRQRLLDVWTVNFASSAPSYFAGAVAAAVAAAVMEQSGTWLTLLLTAAPLYLTYRVYQGRLASEAGKATILEAALDGIITIDHKGRIVEFNPAAARTFGYAREDAIGRDMADLIIPPGLREQHRRGLTRYLATGQSRIIGRRVEMTAIHADGSEFPVEIAITRIPGSDQPLFTGFVRDITERRLLEEQLRQAQKLEAIGRLAGGVAHDFNNILMSIMGCTDMLLLQSPQGDPRRDEAQEIKEAVDRGAALTRQLLAFSRRQQIQPRRIDLAAVVANMNTMLQRLIGPEIAFSMTHDREPVEVVADLGQVEQIVMNLVVNARDAMPQGGKLRVEVGTVELDEATARRVPEGQPGRYARIAVTDTGAGIEPATLSRIFEPFFTTKESGKGTGLGLSTVYGIVKQNHGLISVTSELGRGTSFHIYLPAASTPAPVEPAPAVVAG